MSLRPPFAAVIAIAGLTALGAVAACAPTVHTHGYTPRAGELDDIAVGRDTRSSIQRKLGRPSTVSAFDDATWYYISVKTETLAFYAPEVVDQRVVTVSFDEGGSVVNVSRYGMEDGRVVNLITRTTPTIGKELTILQQIFANLGRFEAEDLDPSSTSRFPR